MEKIRLPEDFTERVMQKIEQRERTAARKMRILTVTGGILATLFLTTAAAAEERSPASSPASHLSCARFSQPPLTRCLVLSLPYSS